MHRFFTPLLLLLLVTACGGGNFDEATIPPDQRSAELAFRRLANHGELEAVIEIDQPISAWQFHVGARQQLSVLGAPPTVTYSLSDRSGIEYTVTSESTPLSILEQVETGTYGYADGRFVAIERDLAGGKIYATLKLDSWRERAK